MGWRAAVGCGVAALALLGQGCGTVGNLQRTAGAKEVPELPPDAPMDRVYGGVRSDWAWVAGGPGGPPPGTGSFLSALLDLPLSAVGDTLTLPYVLAWEKGLLGVHLMHYRNDIPIPAGVERPDAPGGPHDAEVPDARAVAEATPPGGS